MTEVLSRILLEGQGDRRWYVGQLFEWKVRGSGSGGRLTAVEVLACRGGEPPVHVHTREDELFYVLDGEVEFVVGEERATVAAGGCVWAPRDVPHGFRVITDTARMLIVVTPSGIEASFDEFSVPATARTLQPDPVPEPDYAGMEEADRRAGVTYVGSPLAEPIGA